MTETVTPITSNFFTTSANKKEGSFFGRVVIWIKEKWNAICESIAAFFRWIASFFSHTQVYVQPRSPSIQKETPNQIETLNQTQDPLKPLGFPNLGCTCYMNASTQAFLGSSTFMSKLNDQVDVTNEIAKSFKTFINSPNRSNAETLFKVLKEKTDDSELKKATTGNMLDSGPVVELYLDNIWSENAVLDSVISSIDVTNSCYFKKENNKKLYIAMKKTLQDSVNSFFESEVLETYNNLENAYTKQLRLQNEPNLLVLQLKRFDSSSNKIVDVVTLPDNGILTIPKLSGEVQYKIVGIVRHHGQTPTSGHYVAYSLRGDQWYCCSDTSVSKVNYKDMADKGTESNYEFILERVQEDL